LTNVAFALYNFGAGNLLVFALDLALAQPAYMLVFALDLALAQRMHALWY